MGVNLDVSVKEDGALDGDGRDNGPSIRVSVGARDVASAALVCRTSKRGKLGRSHNRAIRKACRKPQRDHVSFRQKEEKNAWKERETHWASALRTPLRTYTASSYEILHSAPGSVNDAGSAKPLPAWVTVLGRSNEKGRRCVP
jgi:hypothetical protein